MPLNGWNNATIEYFINRMSCLDTNNFIGYINIMR